MAHDHDATVRAIDKRRRAQKPFADLATRLAGRVDKSSLPPRDFSSKSLVSRACQPLSSAPLIHDRDHGFADLHQSDGDRLGADIRVTRTESLDRPPVSKIAPENLARQHKRATDPPRTIFRVVETGPPDGPVSKLVRNSHVLTLRAYAIAHPDRPPAPIEHRKRPGPTPNGKAAALRQFERVDWLPVVAPCAVENLGGNPLPRFDIHASIVASGPARLTERVLSR